MGGDKLRTLRYFALLATRRGMRRSSIMVLQRWNTTAASESGDDRPGSRPGAGSPSSGTADAVPDADLSTPRHPGRRATSAACTSTVGRRAVSA